MTTLSYNYESTAIAIVYTATIFGVMYWSGGSEQRTIYNRYLVAAESTSVPTADFARSSRFLRDVLQFRELAPKIRNPEESGVFATPGGFYLTVRPVPGGATAGSGSHTTEIVFRVRNGFTKLRAAFENRLRDFVSSSTTQVPPAEPASGTLAKGPSVTPIVSRPAGDEFSVIDPDGNRFVFFLPTKRTVPRS